MRFYKPLKSHPLSIFVLPIAAGCDRRGSEMLYERNIGRYYLLRLIRLRLPLWQSILHHEALPSNDATVFFIDFCTTKYEFYHNDDNHQFSKKIVSKYFKRFHWLLKDKLVALRDRIRKTKTFVRFSFKTYVIYLQSNVLNLRLILCRKNDGAVLKTIVSFFQLTLGNIFYAITNFIKIIYKII